LDLIKALRTKTKAGISDCRQSLVEAGLDLAKAEAILMSKAKGVAEKKASRLAAEGLLAAVTDANNKKVAIVEVWHLLDSLLSIHPISFCIGNTFDRVLVLRNP
jgi:translation elongation factor EF-Ts